MIRDTETAATGPRAQMVLNGSMPDTVDGLPLHPLLVHFPLVLVPLLVLLVFLYVLIPPLRKRVGWAVLALAVLAPVAVFFARWAGKSFADSVLAALPAGATETDAKADAIAEHEMFGDWLLWLTVGLLPLFLLFGALERGRRSALARATDRPFAAKKDADADAPTPPKPNDDPAAGGRKLVMVIFGVLMLATAAAVAYTAFKSGHTGAKMHWG
ncbi:DUF2231 domain-containing protein [Phytomonospora endophytica]|uniref:Putative membrane protein n=1 Tax=Phytomonospora endophytica TaxID=714109 RepID=A0A841FKI1_9ACTN|nr:DUF2231 domain-containing protein [Phytomonospora endophytica]MBB6033149.1 putative membrane protein [Phytomonospora endophytica]GIG65374.1 hypothetical protein Pen01_16690 [Phytomonospora endophytica]